MMRRLGIMTLGLLLMAGPALAQQTINLSPFAHDNVQSTTTATGGAGGAGGAGGSAVVNGSGNSSNTNVNSNSQGQEQSVNIRNSNKQSQGQGQEQGQSQKQSNKQGQSQGQGQGQTNQPNQTIEGDSTRVYASAPAVFAPALTAVPETCMGSFSGGASGSNGIFGLGLSFGKTYESESCNRRMNARALVTLGPQYHGAALALLAQDESVATALKAAGVPVPGAVAEASMPAALPATVTLVPATAPAGTVVVGVAGGAIGKPVMVPQSRVVEAP